MQQNGVKNIKNVKNKKTNFISECLKIGKKSFYLQLITLKFDHFEKIILLLRKGVMCYEYIASWGKCKEISLPLKEKFFSRLKSKVTSDGD